MNVVIRGLMNYFRKRGVELTYEEVAIMLRELMGQVRKKFDLPEMSDKKTYFSLLNAGISHIDRRK
jgi:hypothetical protein